MQTLKIPIDDQFLPYIEAALIRLDYLLPGLLIEFNKDRNLIEVVELGTHSREELKAEINYTIYREKIFKETLPIRNKILGV